MNIDLKPEYQNAIDLAVQSGLFRNPQELIESALDLMFDESSYEEDLIENHELVAARIAEGFAQAERGELIPGDQVIEELDRRARARLNAEK